MTRICRRLDGLPLALELAAARVRALSAASIAERLDAGLGVPGRGTLDAAIDASYALLSPPERELYGRLSVFAGPFRLEDAERVGAGQGLPAGDVIDLLVSLTEHSMIQAEAGSPRPYRMLEALRDHGRAQLEPAAADAAARRHAVHFARIAACTAGDIHRVGAEAVGDPLVPVHWDLDAAFRWAVSVGETDIALDLATGLGSFHHLVGTVTLGRELIDRALACPAVRPTSASTRCDGRSGCCSASCASRRPPLRSRVRRSWRRATAASARPTSCASSRRSSRSSREIWSEPRRRAPESPSARGVAETATQPPAPTGRRVCWRGPGARQVRRRHTYAPRARTSWR